MSNARHAPGCATNGVAMTATLGGYIEPRCDCNPCKACGVPVGVPVCSCGHVESAHPGNGRACSDGACDYACGTFWFDGLCASCRTLAVSGKAVVDRALHAARTQERAE